MRKKEMDRFGRHQSGSSAGAAEFEMQQRTLRTTGTGRRIEPIFDASGSLKRHVMSKIDDARLHRTPETTDDEGQGDR
jgi:hypothetical protein